MRMMKIRGDSIIQISSSVPNLKTKLKIIITNLLLQLNQKIQIFKMIFKMKKMIK